MHPRLLTVPDFDLLGYSFGPFTLHTYGVLLAIAFLTALWVASRQAKKAGLDSTRVTDMSVWVLIAGLLGAKLLLVLVFLYLTGPTATHAVAHAALDGGLKPWTRSKGKDQD